MSGGIDTVAKLEGYLKKMQKDLIRAEAHNVRSVVEAVSIDIRLALRLIEDEKKVRK